MFQLPNDTECELTSFIGRTQKSGPDDVPAVTFRLKLAGVSNILLDLFSQTIRHTIYKAVEGQDQLPGVEEVTPLLQSKDLTDWAPETCLEGWHVIVARGIGDDSALQMHTCKIDNFRFALFEGGHMDVDFRVSTADVDEAGAGMLWGRQKRKVFVMITAPQVAENSPPIDGSVDAFKRDHPDFDGPDAGDLFAAGSDSAADRHAGNFGQADDDGAGPGTGSSDDASSGADSEGGETDAAGDAAEFEAGAAAAIDKATGARRGRRPLASVK